MIKKKFLTSTIILTLLCSILVPYTTHATIINEAQSTYSTNFKEQYVKYGNIKYKYQILQDDKNIRRVKVTAKDGTSIAVYDKKTGEYKVEDKKGKVFSAKINPKIASTITNNSVPTATTAKLKSKKNIYSQSESVWGSKCKITKYVYTKPSKTKYVWYIATGPKKGQSKSVTESSRNRDDLESFRSAIKTAKTKELEAAAAMGTAYAAAIAALVTAAPTAGVSVVLAILASVGAAGTGAVLLWQAFDAHNDAIYYYKRV